MRSQYAGLRESSCPPLAVVSGGGSFTAASIGTYYAYLQGRNRAGHQLFSTAVSFDITAAGQMVDITIPADCRRAGEDLHRVFVSINPGSDTPAASGVVAAFEALASDQETLIALPAVITLDQDEHLVISGSVATSAALPGPGVRLNGMRRNVSDLGYIVEFLDSTSTWVRVEPNAFNTNISNTTNVDGANVDVRDIADTAVIIKATYGATGGAGIPVKLWIVNDEATAIPQGTIIGFTLELNGEDVSDTFVGLMKVRFLGYADTVTGLLDTTGPGGSGTMDGVGETVDYQNRRSNIILQKDLPVGSAYMVELIPTFSAFALMGRIAQGASIRAFAFFYINIATYTPSGLLSGDFIANEGNLRRLVPQTGLSVLALGGSGVVNSYAFRDVAAQLVAGLVANTDDQLAVIAGNGVVFIDTTVPTLSAQRAIVGTVDGIGQPTALAAGTLSLDNTTLLNFTLTHPEAIRSDYPDVIAGSTEGTFNAGQAYIYIRPTSGNVLRFEGAIAPGATQTSYVIGLTTLTDTGSSTLPSQTQTDFSLYEYTTNSFSFASSAGASNFPAGPAIYQFAVAPRYDNTATRIRHGTEFGNIDEALKSLIEAIARTCFWAQAATSIAGARAIASSEWSDNQIRLLNQAGDRSLLVYDATSTDADNGDTILKPDDLAATSPGRIVELPFLPTPSIGTPVGVRSVTEAITATKSLVANDPNHQFLDPGTDTFNVVLPSPAAADMQVSVWNTNATGTLVLLENATDTSGVVLATTSSRTVIEFTRDESNTNWFGRS